MQRTRPFTTQRLYGMGFILIVLSIILGIHGTFTCLVWFPYLWSRSAVWVMLLYHLFFVNLMLSFYQCIMIDPGLVPPNWGFYMGDETKRRRYCKMCNVWKPDRTHHCSICNRCILNMDHHCPWINNCVGFYNRKFFIQLLCYVYLSITVVVIFIQPELWSRLGSLVRSPIKFTDVWYLLSSVLIFLAFGMSTLLLGTLTNFIKFHVKLVMDNYTTIENLEREDGVKSKFDIGQRRNWEQVFGSNQWLWWMPMHTQTSRPIGDGVRWRVHYTRVIDEDEEMPGDDEGQTSKLLPQGSRGSSAR